MGMRIKSQLSEADIALMAKARMRMGRVGSGNRFSTALEVSEKGVNLD
jgi:hypothetical protein